jgi:hypothetical protein
MGYMNVSFVSDNFYPNSADSANGEILTYCSMYPYEDAMYYIDAYQKLPCLPDILKANGYRIGYFAPYSEEWRGLQDFLRSRGEWDMLLDEDGINKTGYLSGTWGVEEKSLIKPFLNWSASGGSKPFFGIIRFSTGHLPLNDLPKEYRRFGDDRYDGIYYVDSFMGDLLEGLRNVSVMDNTLVVLVGDHTSTRFDQGRVPFIMINPILFRGGIRSGVPASQVDVAPTILDLLSIQTLNSFQGDDILRLNGSGRRVYFTSNIQKYGFLEGGLKFAFDVNTQRDSIYNGTAKINDRGLEGRFYDELMGWKLRQKELYIKDRIFDESLLTQTSNNSASERSCWSLRHDPQGYVWADSANSSSNLLNQTNMAMEAAGPPDTPPCTKSYNAWGPKPGRTHEWLQTFYDKPLHPENVVICENHQAPFVTKVELLDTAGGYHVVWNDDGGDDNTTCDGRMELEFNRTEYLVRGVRVSTFCGGIEQIDAVGIR